MLNMLRTTLTRSLTHKLIHSLCSCNISFPWPLSPLASQGITAIICMPTNTADIKLANVQRLGGVVELVGESYQEAQVYAQVRAAVASKMCSCR
jgi:hypothetical protein